MILLKSIWEVPMYLNTFIGLSIPLLGTVLGSACVYFFKQEIKENIHRFFIGSAAGVMVAASVWSLLIPAIELSESLGRFSFLPAVIGFMIGVGFLLLLDMIIPHLHQEETEPEGIKTDFKKSTLLLLAVALHNVPEGMAVGVVFASFFSNQTMLSMASAFALAIGIAIQNFPEGAIIALPLHSNGMNKHKAFFFGALSGVVEPLAGLLTILASNFIIHLLPYLLSFAAGAMMYVVVEELIPEASSGKHSNVGVLSFSIGFCLMLILDVALG